MPKDACYRKIMKSYGKWSARAAQATAKCRKAKGKVRKTKAGSNLKRWGKEKWVDTRTGKACGSGGKNEYCRPTKRVSSKTPKTAGELSKSEKKSRISQKKRLGQPAGKPRRVKAVKRRKS